MKSITNPEEFQKQVLDWYTNKTNRSVNQTRTLCEITKEWDILLELEEAVKFFNCYYCPGTLAEASYLLGLFRVWKLMNWTNPGYKYAYS